MDRQQLSKLGRIAATTTLSIMVGLSALAFSASADADPGLAPSEQQFVNDLVAVGLTPTGGDRAIVNSGYRVCDALATGKTRDYVTQTVYGSIGGSHLNQAQVVVDSAIRNLCPANASAPQHDPIVQPGAPDDPAQHPALNDPAQHPILNDTPPLMGPRTSPYGPGNYGPGDLGH